MKTPAHPHDELILPHDIEAERLVLGAVLVDGFSVLDGVQLDGRDFWRKPHSDLWQGMCDLHARGCPVELGTLKEVVDLDAVGGMAYVCSLIDGMPHRWNAAYHAERVKVRAVARRAVMECRRTEKLICDEPEGVTNGIPAEHAARWTEIIQCAVRERGDGCAEPLSALLADITVTNREMVINDLLAMGEVGMLHGQPRDGKTWAALDLALAATTASPAFEVERLRAPIARPVLVVSNEDSRSAYAERFRLLLAGRELSAAPESLRLLVGRGVSLDDPDWCQRLLDEVRHERVGLVIIDPLRSVTAFADQSPSEFRPVGTYLRRLVSETGCAVLVVHHDVKPRAEGNDTRRRAQRASGGGVFSVVDSPVHVERLDGERSLFTPDGTKHRPDAAPVVVTRQAGEGWVRLIGETTTGASAEAVSLDSAIVEYLRNTGGQSQRAIARAVDRHHQAVRLALDRLFVAGVTDVAEGPRRARLWRLQ